MTKTTRGRPSKVDLLPQHIKDELNKLLRDKSMTQQDIRAAINELIDEHGLSDDMKLSRTGLNRYATRMEDVAQKFASQEKLLKHGRQNLVMRQLLMSVNCCRKLYGLWLLRPQCI